MKKLITMLSALTITSTAVSTIIACSKEEDEKGFNLNTLNADSLKVLKDYDFEKNPGSVPKIKETKIKIIKDEDMTNAISAHLQVLLMQNLFEVKNFDPKVESHDINYTLTMLLIGSGGTPIIKQTVTSITPNKKYEIKIEKEKWDNIKDKAQDLITEALKHAGPNGSELAKKISVENLKSYYDLIKGESVTITIEINK